MNIFNKYANVPFVINTVELYDFRYDVFLIINS